MSRLGDSALVRHVPDIRHLRHRSSLRSVRLSHSGVVLSSRYCSLLTRFDHSDGNVSIGLHSTESRAVPYVSSAVPDFGQAVTQSARVRIAL